MLKDTMDAIKKKVPVDPNLKTSKEYGVKGRWDSVEIVITDKERNTESLAVASTL